MLSLQNYKMNDTYNINNYEEYNLLNNNKLNEEEKEIIKNIKKITINNLDIKNFDKPFINNMKNIEEIEIKYCFNLEKIPNEFNKLKNIIIFCCNNFKELPDNLNNPIIKISCCPNIKIRYTYNFIEIINCINLKNNKILNNQTNYIYNEYYKLNIIKMILQFLHNFNFNINKQNEINEQFYKTKLNLTNDEYNILFNNKNELLNEIKSKYIINEFIYKETSNIINKKNLNIYVNIINYKEISKIINFYDENIIYKLFNYFYILMIINNININNNNDYIFIKKELINYFNKNKLNNLNVNNINMIINFLLYLNEELKKYIVI